ncbi:hypothetical protein KR067_005623, partial [Drosophila pandora]
MSLLCRICNLEAENFKNLFDKESLEILNNIFKLTGISLRDQDGVPNRICSSCSLDLDAAIAFRERCILANIYWTKKCQDAGVLDIPEMVQLNSSAREINQTAKMSCNVDGTLCVTKDDTSLSSPPTANDSDPLMNENSIKIEPVTEKDTVFPTHHLTLSGSGLVNVAAGNPEITLKEPIVCKKRGRPKKPKELFKNTTVKRNLEQGHYICDQCGKTFSEKGNFNVHLTRHLGVKQFQCQECDRSEFTMHLLKLHVRIKHRGELPYICKYCGQRFKNCNIRLKHERRHKESPVHRPHLCHICGKAFLDKESLRLHSVVHTGEQPYHCELCKVKFNRKSSLVTHYRSKIHKKKQEEQN